MLYLLRGSPNGHRWVMPRRTPLLRRAVAGADPIFRKVLMATEADNTEFPSLFAHTLRKEWGVGVLASEKDGKRRYLFENGEERTLANGFHQMMLRVETPSPDQQVAFARLQGILAGRARDPDAAGAKPTGWSLGNQLAKFRESYPAGVSDPDWIAEVRGGASGSQSRQSILKDAQEQLSAKAIDSLLSGQKFTELWELVVALVSRGNLVPSSQLKLKAPSGEPLRVLAVAIRELLHGTPSYDKRFDRFLSAFEAAVGAAPGWELATALSALVHPIEHVCIEPSMFKKQLKVSSIKRTIAARPSSTGYASFLSIARLVANKLAEQGEVPRDLWDVRDFIVFTLKPVPKPKAPKKIAVVA